MRFSERHGYRPVREVFQIESMNDELRNSLWSILQLTLWDTVLISRYAPGTFRSENPKIWSLFRQLWLDFFKLPVDTLHDNWPKVLSSVRAHFFKCEWFDVFDFVEFVAGNYPGSDPDKFISLCNKSLKREVSAYRFVNGTLAKITTEEEAAEIETAIREADSPVRAHLRRALELLSDRKTPDYRNSIKESISSVESLVSNTLGQKGTLGGLVRKLESEIALHPALGKALSSLYGYTSDEDGIRHAILESENVSFEDAKFFLVICSAFINFVNAKTAVHIQPKQ